MNQVAIKREIRRQAKAWMVLNRIRNVDIECATGIKSPTIVSTTLSGRRNNKKVLNFLLEKGCPRDYLALPPSMEEAV